MHPIILALAVGSVSLNAMAQIALKKTMLSAGPLPSGIANALGFAFSLLLNPWFLAGMTCYALYRDFSVKRKTIYAAPFLILSVLAACG